MGAEEGRRDEEDSSSTSPSSENGNPSEGSSTNGFRIGGEGNASSSGGSLTGGSAFDVKEILDQVFLLCRSPIAGWGETLEKGRSTEQVMKGFYLPLLITANIAAMIGVLSVAKVFPLIIYTAVQIGVGVIMPTLFAMALAKAAPKLGAEEMSTEALKQLLMYAFLPSLFFQIFTVIPFLAFVAIIGGILSLVALYGGVKMLPGVPEGRTVGFYVVSILALILISIVIWVPLSLILPNPFPAEEILAGLQQGETAEALKMLENFNSQ